MGDRSAAAFLQLYDRLPEAERYCSERLLCGVPRFPQDRHLVGKEGRAVNWNEGLHSV